MIVCKKYILTSLLLSLFFNIAAVHTPLRILVVVGAFPVLSEVAILNQITCLIDRGHEVSIFAMRRSTSKSMHEEVIRYNLMECVQYKEIRTSELKKYDLILCQFGPIGADLARIKKKHNLAVPLVTCFRGHDTSCRVRSNPHLYDELFEVGDLFLPVCDFFKKRLILLGAPPEKIKVQYSAIDCKKFCFKERIIPESGPIHIITAARLVPKKGHYYVLHALAKLVKQFPQVHYTIVGSGKLKNNLTDLVNTLKLSPYVTFIDAVPHEHLITMLNTVDLFVLPSVVDNKGDAEGIPNALKEAMVMGIPVISTRHSGTPELISHMHSGLLVEEKNVDELYQALRYALEHPVEMKKMALNGHKKVLQDFELNSQGDRLERHLLKLFG